MRRHDGSLPRTAAAILLGLTAAAMPVAAGTGCGSDVDTTKDSSGSSNGDGGAGQGGEGQGGTLADVSSAAAYGVGGSISSSVGGMGGAGDGGMGGIASAYGLPATDSDMDGYIDAAEGGDDCDDMNPDVHPGAPDKPGDGIDSDCDGTDE